jgi:uncharacterized protein YjbK
LSQEIEIEFKNLLTNNEFNKIKEYLNLTDSMFIKQENHYFDAPNFSLKGLGCALRIRLKKGKYELTLKEPITEGLLETTQLLPPETAEKMLENGCIPEGVVKNQLLQLHIDPSKIIYFGSLTTERAEKEFESGLLVLDYSYYLNEHDFELEYEVNDFKSGRRIFAELLETLHIPLRKTENKIKRFYEAKYKQNGDIPFRRGE